MLSLGERRANTNASPSRCLLESHGLATRPLPRRANTLELAFDSLSLRATCENEAQARSELGDAVADMLKHRLGDLRAATSSKDLLAGKPRVSTDGQHMIVDVGDTHRIVFKANHIKCPMTNTKEVDWERVSRIKILRIEGDNA